MWHERSPEQSSLGPTQAFEDTSIVTDGVTTGMFKVVLNLLTPAMCCQKFLRLKVYRVENQNSSLSSANHLPPFVMRGYLHQGMNKCSLRALGWAAAPYTNDMILASPGSTVSWGNWNIQQETVRMRQMTWALVCSFIKWQEQFTVLHLRGFWVACGCSETSVRDAIPWRKTDWQRQSMKWEETTTTELCKHKEKVRPVLPMKQMKPNSDLSLIPGV